MFELYIREHDEYALKFGFSHNVKKRIKSIDSEYRCCEKIKIIGIIEPNDSTSENDFLEKLQIKRLKYDKKKVNNRQRR